MTNARTRRIVSTSAAVLFAVGALASNAAGQGMPNSPGAGGPAGAAAQPSPGGGGTSKKAQQQREQQQQRAQQRPAPQNGTVGSGAQQKAPKGEGRGGAPR